MHELKAKSTKNKADITKCRKIKYQLPAWPTFIAQTSSATVPLGYRHCGLKPFLKDNR